MATSRSITFSCRLALVFTGLLAGLALVELGLRAASIEYPNFFTMDDQIGFALRPGAHGWWLTEGRGYAQINHAGFRDRERPRSKPSGTVRIAVLGDSYVEAMQVAEDRRFTAVVQRRLAGCARRDGRAIEVMNFGVSSSGPAQELQILRHRVWAYDPDIIVVAVMTGNDIHNSQRELNGYPFTPYLVRQDGRYVMDESFRQFPYVRRYRSRVFHILEAALDHSRILQVCLFARRQFRERYLEAHTEPLRGMQYRAPDTQVWQEAWDATEAAYTMMRDDALAHGARFLMVTLSNNIQVDPDPAVRQRSMRELGVQDLWYPDERIRGFCERERIPVLTLGPALLQYAQERQVYLHGFGKRRGHGHWNEAGHDAAGTLLAEWLCQRLN